MQDKASLGTRYTCYKCEKKFYDLGRPEPICPGCSADQREDPAPDPRVAVMARYKGTRLTTDQTMPSKEQFKVDEDTTEKSTEGETADGETADGEEATTATEAGANQDEEGAEPALAEEASPES